jgi:hypothetical protein
MSKSDKRFSWILAGTLFMGFSTVTMLLKVPTSSAKPSISSPDRETRWMRQPHGDKLARNTSY